MAEGTIEKFPASCEKRLAKGNFIQSSLVTITMKKYWAFLIPLLLSLSACAAQLQPTPDVSGMVSSTLTAIAHNNPQIVVQQTTGTPTTPSTEPAPLQSITPGEESSHLSLDVLRNGSYHSPDWGDFQLSDGIYYRTPPTSQESPEAYTTRLLEPILYGDINSDGMEDAVVFLATQNGGTGHFVEMAAVLNLNGNASNISTLYLGDRIIIESGAIQNGSITLSLIVQGPNDGLCCPSQKETRNYRLDGGQLVEIP
jgi:hypothetical protein